jgi:FtsH-binding integral membrane protein
MANWSDPWATAARTTNVDARGAAYDAGLRSYMLSVYNYMASGVLLTGVVALLFANSPYMSLLFSPQGRPSGLGYVVMFAPLGVVLWLSFGINRISETTAKALFWAYAVLMGLSLSTVCWSIPAPRSRRPSSRRQRRSAVSACGATPPSATCRRWAAS